VESVLREAESTVGRVCETGKFQAGSERIKQGDHSFSTMIFFDFSITKKMNFHDLSAQHIFSKWTTHDLWMLTRIKIYFQLLVNQSVSKTSVTTNRMIFTETKILVHFYKKNPGHHHRFPWLSMTLAVFHDFPGLENGLTEFQDFPGRVVILIKADKVSDIVSYARSKMVTLEPRFRHYDWEFPSTDREKELSYICSCWKRKTHWSVFCWFGY